MPQNTSDRHTSDHAPITTAAQPASMSHHHRMEVHNMERSIWAHVSHNPIRSMWDLHGLSVKEIAKRTWKGIDEDNLFGRASQLAYAFFSAIFPALIAISSLMGLIAKSSTHLYVELLDRIGRLIPPTAFALVIETFQQTTSASTVGKVSLGIVVALFSASVGIGAIQDTLNTVYKVKETRPFWKARLQAMGITLIVAAVVILALLTLFTGDFTATYLHRHAFAGSSAVSIALRVAAWILASLLMILSFEVMYYLCPDLKERKWRGFTPGGLIGLAGWVLGSIILRVYLHFFNTFSVTYGSLGAVIILLLWFYITGVMILLGGEVNSEIEHAVAERALQTGTAAAPTESQIASTAA